MPVPVSGWLELPPNHPAYILEDKYLSGGLRVVADQDALDAVVADIEIELPLPDDAPEGTEPTIVTIPRQGIKVGMVAVKADDMTWWQLQEDKTWAEVDFGVTLVGDAPIDVSVDGHVSIDPDRVLPTGGVPGDALLFTLTGPSWGAVPGGGGGGGVRSSSQFDVPETIAPGDDYEFSVVMGKTCILLECAVDTACRVEAFSDPTRSDSNPFTFLADNTRLEDDGSSKLSDGSIFYGRRYSVLANLEATPTNNIYWRITNTQSVSISPILNLNFLILE
jgi:hypothetical protein